jgi:hypothetical protein
MSSLGKCETATKAAGLLQQFIAAVTILGLKMAMKIFGPLEQLNRSLQSTSATLSGMLQAVKTVKLELMNLRTDNTFHAIFEEVGAICETLDVAPLSLPRMRRPPKKITGPGDSYVPATPEEHFRVLFFTAIDTAHTQLCERLEKSLPGVSAYLALESILESGNTDAEVCGRYPELDAESLAIQLRTFHNNFGAKSLSVAQHVLQNMVPEVRILFASVEQLVRLMLICPMSSCTAERSFSALRRLKTWLRNSMSQERLNAVTVCHVNQTTLDNVDMKQIAFQFSQTSDVRKNVFGTAPF